MQIASNKGGTYSTQHGRGVAKPPLGNTGKQAIFIDLLREKAVAALEPMRTVRSNRCGHGASVTPAVGIVGITRLADIFTESVTIHINTNGVCCVFKYIQQRCSDA